MVHVSDLSLQYCVGCGSCYKTGACIYKDDIENLSLSVADADGIIIGSPTYASNVSGQMKVIIDRGHFVMEQLLHGKYAICVTTYENYGGRDSTKILNKLLLYSGAKISASIALRNRFNKNPMEDYQKAVNCDPNNGNRFFSLGYAQASVNKIAEAMQNFAKADELLVLLTVMVLMVSMVL